MNLVKVPDNKPFLISPEEQAEAQEAIPPGAEIVHVNWGVKPLDR